MKVTQIATTENEIVILTDTGDIFVYDMMDNEWKKVKPLGKRIKYYGKN